YKSSSVFALFWNIVNSIGPQAVVSDLENLVKKHNLYKMDPEIAGGGTQKTYTIDVDAGLPLVFRNADLSLPSGQSIARSCFDLHNTRYVHRENQPHDWASSWTTFRDHSMNYAGGHFYLCEYGIRIRGGSKLRFGSRANGMPPAYRDWNLDPLLQCGLAIVASARLPAPFKTFHEGKMSEAEMKVQSTTSEEAGLDGNTEDAAP
ncbi:hypothetical protein BDP27DRAFT_1227781, partial [Rhodocollybia butyracea]